MGQRNGIKGDIADVPREIKRIVGEVRKRKQKGGGEKEKKGREQSWQDFGAKVIARFVHAMFYEADHVPVLNQFSRRFMKGEEWADLQTEVVECLNQARDMLQQFLRAAEETGEEAGAELMERAETGTRAMAAEATETARVEVADENAALPVPVGA